ncbi:T9SS type A sorting domain-containing protein [Ascidiimonas aurantiaca]|uniref:T9SS type A sorting domain-containing protein n=1 Tax=Ascidiimonas aurantiaca TaxID=1685432 RepID=UPI0030EEDD3D
MKKLVLPALFTITFGFSQLHVSTDSFIYVKGEQVFVGDFGDSNPDINLAGVSATDYTLANNGYIFLRDEGMLFQTLSSNPPENSGLGKISLYQEGTANNYNYNYWGSPVHAPGEPTGFRVSQLFDPDVTGDTAPFPAAFTSGRDGTTGDGTGTVDLTIASRWIFTFEAASGYVNWNPVGSTGLIKKGLGFTMKGTSGSSNAQRYDFRGVPNSGDIAVTIAADQLTLAGNPYPSALDLKRFLVDNTSVLDGFIYLWQQDRTVNSHSLVDYIGGYATYAPGNPGDLGDDGIYTDATFLQADATGDSGSGSFANTDGIIGTPRYAPVGQGFMIRGALSPSGPEALFTNSQRAFVKETSTDDGTSNDNSIFNRTKGKVTLPKEENKKVEVDENIVVKAPVRSVLRFGVRILRAGNNGALVKNMVLAFDDNYSTDAVDWGTDALDNSFLENNVYWPIEGEKYVIQSTNFVRNKEIALGFELASQTTFEITLYEKENFDSTMPIYLLDKLTGIYHEITDKSASVLKTLEAGNHEERFVITFTNGNDILQEDEEDNDEDIIVEAGEFEIFHSHIDKQVVLRNAAQQGITGIYMYDINGRLLYSDTGEFTQNEINISTAQLSTGVYIVNVETQNQKNITKKIAVSN